MLVDETSGGQWGLLNRCASLSGNNAVTVALILAEQLAQTAFEWGADEVGILCSATNAERAGRQIAEWAVKTQPSAILFSATDFGKTAAATVAASLNTGLAADCVSIDKRGDGLLVMTRPTFAGTLMADIICVKSPQMATVRVGAYLPRKAYKTSNRLVFHIAAARAVSGAELIERTVIQTLALSSADIIVAGGAGIGSSEGFNMLDILAGRIGAVVGASRGAVNLGYAPYNRQIGLSGQIVRPDLYIAFGISGAVQHLVGMERSGTVVAVNSDKNAAIFEYADYGIVTDWRDVAMSLLERCPANTDV